MTVRWREPASLIEILDAHAERSPERCGYIFLQHGEREEARLDYGQLATRARAIATAVQAEIAAGDRVLLLFPHGREFVTAFLGCLHAGAIAIPAPGLARPLSRAVYRLQGIVADGKPRLVLTTSAMLDMARQVCEQLPELAGTARVLAVETIEDGLASAWRRPQLGREDLAFLQYTSGSTSTPKGVMVSHGNLLSDAACYLEGFHHHEGTVTVTWMPHFHDFGLMDGISEPLLGGFPVISMSPLAFMQRPMRWLEAVSRYQATFTSGPNFAFDLCVRQAVAPEALAALQLGSLACVAVGAEPVRLATLQRFAERFAPAGFRFDAFRPGYGLAEATLKVTTTRWDQPPTFLQVDRAALEAGRVVSHSPEAQALTLAACGPITSAEFETEIVIVDPATLQRVPDGSVGEICVCGPMVARGYWGRPDATRETFVTLATDRGDARFLRTGDLGFAHQGQLYITGRIKDLIIIHGRNLYPQDLEFTAEAACPDALRAGGSAAFTVAAEAAAEAERLVLVTEVAHKTPRRAKDIIDAIRHKLMELLEVTPHDVVLIQENTLPKTSSGKIRRRECRQLYLSGALARFDGPAA